MNPPPQTLNRGCTRHPLSTQHRSGDQDLAAPAVTRRTFLAQLGMAAALSGSVAPAAAPAPASGPRLFYDHTDIARIRNRAASDEAFARGWQRLLARADELLSTAFMAEAQMRIGPGQHGSSHGAARQLQEMSMLLGLAFHVTREHRYAEKLAAALQHYVAFSEWRGPGFGRREPPWRSELATGTFILATALGYDVLRDVLGVAEREEIRRGLLRLGLEPAAQDWLLPGDRIHALDSMGHNWWSVCVAMIGVGALAIAPEEPRAADWLTEVDDALEEFFIFRGSVLHNKSTNFDTHGAFYEGVGYTNYGVGEYLVYRLAALRAGRPRPPHERESIAGAARFVTHALYPTTDGHLAVDFGDSRITASCAMLMRVALEAGLGGELEQWHLWRVTNRSGLEPRLSFWDAIARIDLPKNPKMPALPRSMLYPDIGWAMLRSAWSDDATLLAVRSGMTWNHAHSDAGTFVIYHRGRPLVMDSGMCGYSAPEYKQFYVTSRAHNVVLCDSRGEELENWERGTKFSGHVHSLLDGAGLRYVYADATGPMAHLCSRNYRNWIWVGDVIVVFDEIRAHEAVRFDWLLHHGGDFESRERGGVIRNGAAEAQVQFLHPSTLDAAIEQGLQPGAPSQPRAFRRFSTRERAREGRFVTAFVLNSDAPRPRVEPLEAPFGVGARIVEENVVTDIWMNQRADGRAMHVNSIATLDGWTTDAYLVALTRPRDAAATPQTLTRVLLVHGSFLRRDAGTVWESFSKVDALFDFAPERSLWLHGQERVRATMLGRGARTLAINGAPSAFATAAADRIRFTHLAKSA